mgnify:CR=1 FL=1
MSTNQFSDSLNKQAFAKLDKASRSNYRSLTKTMYFLFLSSLFDKYRFYFEYDFFFKAYSCFHFNFFGDGLLAITILPADKSDTREVNTSL